jgi:hypothetical protein
VFWKGQTVSLRLSVRNEIADDFMSVDAPTSVAITAVIQRVRCREDFLRPP